MKKFKGLLLLALCALATSNVQAQDIFGRTQTAQEVIDILTANGGHCQSLFYSASYQSDACSTKDRVFTNNMWIKDSFAKGRFVQKSTADVDWHDFDGNAGTSAKMVTLENAFGGLFDWDFVISDDYCNVMAQPVDKKYQIKGTGNEHKYVRIHMMQPDDFTYAEEGIKRRTGVEELTTETSLISDVALQVWLSQTDISNFEWLGVTPWGHAHFDESLMLAPYWGQRHYFMRLAVKNDGVDGIRGTADDFEETHYDFLYAEFRHYNPNTVVNDTHNGEGRSFEAIADYEDKANGDTQFWMHNFSGFGPLYTQTLGTQTDADLDQLLAGTGLTQVNRGYGEGLKSEIHPLTGYLKADGSKILITREENPAGFTHYHRAYEAIKNVEGVTAAQIEANKYNHAITLWHDNRIAGLVEGAYSRDADGHIIPESITALKDRVEGTWTNGQRHHHADNGEASEATNPWVSDGGTCRTISTKHLHIDPYVYCTDEQLQAGQNGTASGLALFDSDDNYKRGGIYELIDIETAHDSEDITLQLAIDNHEVAVDGVITTLLKASICQYKITETVGGQTVDKHYVACPVMFDVTANEQFVDHYEVCAYHTKDLEHPVEDASDAIFADPNSKLNEIMTPAATYVLPKNETGHYEAFELETPAQAPEDKHMITTTLPRYTKVLSVPLDGEHKNELETFTFYVKAVYTEESGLAPTYHSLTNVIVQEGLVTGVKDVNIDGGVKAVAGVYSITGQYLGSQVPEGRGVFVVRYTDGSATKVAVK
ncbi:MAG: hypothetical protein MJZ63_03730 [Muribaculaceae bacterium]|nr:hypothetical protein [Muribaculaceae bacterium]